MTADPPRVDIVSIGEAMIEFNQVRPDAPEFLQGFGGDTSNAIIAAARQGAGTAYVTRLGADAFGDMLMALWAREGVATDAVIRDPQAPTAVYFVTHGASGHAFSYRRAGSAASRIVPAELPATLIRGAKFLHVSGISQAISASACDTVFAGIALARVAGVKVAYGSNLRLQLWPLARARALIRETIAHCDLFLPSLEDAERFTGLAGRDAIVDWCLAAGDALNAAVVYANAAAALTTTGFGAVAPIRARPRCAPCWRRRIRRS